MSTFIFGVSPGPDVEAAEKLLNQGRPYIDAIELRLDHFSKIDMPALEGFLKTCGVPVLFVVRRNDQGGAFQGSESERLALLESLCGLQPAYFDLEYDVPQEFRKKLFESYPKVTFLCSYHNFTETPEDLNGLLEKMKTPYTHLYKMSLFAKSSNDALRLLTFIKSCPEKLIGISMGEEGKFSRILAPIAGMAFTYAMIAEGFATAPGQVSAKEMQEIYHFRNLNKETRIYALIGDPVDKSLGHITHNAVFEEGKVNAVYVRIRIQPEDLPTFFKLIVQFPFRGSSVTMPLKEQVIPFLSQISIETRLIGACNTFVIEEDKITGHNTDGIGALNAIEKRGPVFGKRIFFIGAGGAAKALIFEAGKRGAYCMVVNRTPDRALEIAEIVKGEGGGFDQVPEILKKGYDVIINCTPESEFIDDSWILPEKIAMHIVSVPRETQFVMKALQKKCRIIYGYEMFIDQAVEQFRFWLPDELDFEKVYKTIETKAKGVLV